MSQNQECSAYLPLALRLAEKYNIQISTSDYYAAYGKYNIAQKQSAAPLFSKIQPKNKVLLQINTYDKK